MAKKLRFLFFFFWSRDQHQEPPSLIFFQNSTKPFLPASLTNVHCTTQLFNHKIAFFLLNQYNNTLTVGIVMFIKCVQPLLVWEVVWLGSGVDEEGFTCQGAAPWGPPPQTWSCAGKWRPLFHRSDDDHMSAQHTSWDGSPPGQKKKLSRANPT